MKILIVLTNTSLIPNTKFETGFHFSEFSHPYKFFTDHGYDVVVASPKGGKCPITSPHPEDKINSSFYNDPKKMEIVNNTVKLSDLHGDDFNAIYLAGGHGTMFDLPNDPDLGEIINKTYKAGGILASVCHGGAGFVGVKNDKGEYLVNGKKINCFSNAEEELTPYVHLVPFLLQDKLIEQGAKYESSGIREAHLAVDQRFVTGQNPESVGMVIGAMYTLLQINS